MKAVDIPAKFSIPFAKNAAGAFIRVIPVTTATPGAASLDQGFPPLTAIPVASGGIPPNIQDINGLLQQSTAWDRWQAAGGSSPQWDSAFSALIGGYPKGAIVASALPANFGQLWLCTVDDNVTNPDSSGAGWYGFYVNKGPTRTVLTTASASPYVPPTGVVRLFIRQIGGGGGGGGGGTNPTPASSGTAGGDTSFGTTIAKGGSFGTGGGVVGSGLGGTGGTGGSGPASLRYPGASGTVGLPVIGTSVFASGGMGGSGPFGGAGTNPNNFALAASPNSGSGGAGGPSQSVSGFGGGGGGVGEYLEQIVNSPSVSTSFTVGAGGSGGAAGAGAVGSAGGSGVIIIDEYYSN